MKFKYRASIFFGLLFLFIILQSKKNIRNNDCRLKMKWYKSYEQENWTNVKTGALWSFSYMGAMLSKGDFDKSISFYDSSLFEVDFNKLGFNQTALNALQIICDSIKKTEEYHRNGFIDLARFFVLTLYSPYNYYKVTNAEPNLFSFLKTHKIDESESFGITQSSITQGHRQIKFSIDSSIQKMCVVAEEGYGSLFDNSFKSQKFETITIMSNGQFKYAIYNHQGRLIDAADQKISQAGKPGKCMWCHEVDFQQLRINNIAINPMMSNSQFKRKITNMQNALNTYRGQLNSDINFKNKLDHTQSELLYIGFMEPTSYRLKQEFENDTISFQKTTKLQTHIYDEFLFLGDLYSRKDIDLYFSYSRIAIPEFVREKSTNEPMYFKN